MVKMENNFNMKNFKKMFEEAIDNNKKYCAIVVENSDYKKPEIIINLRENFEDKLEYYLRAYDENLVLKNCEKIKISKAIFSNNLRDIFQIIYK